MNSLAADQYVSRVAGLSREMSTLGNRLDSVIRSVERTKGTLSAIADNDLPDGESCGAVAGLEVEQAISRLSRVEQTVAAQRDAIAGVSKQAREFVEGVESQQADGAGLTQAPADAAKLVASANAVLEARETSEAVAELNRLSISFETEEGLGETVPSNLICSNSVISDGLANAAADLAELSQIRFPEFTTGTILQGPDAAMADLVRLSGLRGGASEGEGLAGPGNSTHSDGVADSPLGRALLPLAVALLTHSLLFMSAFWGAVPLRLSRIRGLVEKWISHRGTRS